MNDIEKSLDIEPYSLDKREKREFLNRNLKHLTVHHYNKCEPYRKMMDAKGLDINKLPDYDSLPFLPVRLFKDLSLKSCDDNEVVKTMTSSGTTGQAVSKIYLDRETSALQQKCLTKIVSHFIGSKRLPMLILDTPSVLKDRNMFSARGAGILGFSVFGTKRVYALNDDMTLNVEAVKNFLEEYGDEPFLMFGFTFMIWQHFYKELKEKNLNLDMSNGILIHGGGWKKLVQEKVTSEKYKDALNSVCGIQQKNIHDYYGMVEQTGCIYMECEHNHLHASAFSDIIIRRPLDFSIADNGEQGLIEVVSILPHSYPGHVLLTEDTGTILGEDDCPCGLKGKYFKIEGRIKNAEIRGCSDTYAFNKP